MAASASSTEQIELNRDLRLFDITMIGVGAMIGAGIFVLTGLAAGAAGPALILAFGLNGIVTIFTAMVYAELGSAIPEAGGGYLWVKEGLPGGNAFQAGWMSWFAHAVAGSLYASGFGSFLNEALKALGYHLDTFLPQVVVTRGFGVGIVLVFLYINYRGASETGKAGNIVTLLKLAIILFFIGCGFYTIWKHPAFLNKFADFSPEGLGGIAVAMGLTFIAFEGYEIIVQAGEEVQNPRENIPKAVFLSLLIVVPIYMLVAFVLIGGVVVPDGSTLPIHQWLGQLGELGLIEAAGQFVPFGKFILLIGALLSTMSALNATTYSSSRVSFAMGRDKNLPDLFGTIHKKRHTPAWAIVGSGVIMIGVLTSLPIHDVAAAADIMFLLLFLQVNIAVITIRKKYGNKLAYGYLTPFFPYVPILGIISKFLLAIYLFHYSPIAWYYAVGWIIAGLIIFQFYASKREREKVATPVIVEERAMTTRDVFRVLVAVANPQTAKDLIRQAAKLVRREQGELLLLHVVVVPPQLPLDAGRDLIKQSRQVIDEAAAFAEQQGIPVSTLVRLAHDPASAIIHTVEERTINYVVLGWRGNTSNPYTQIGGNIDRIGNYANANVIILQQAQDREPQSILIPVSRARQAPLSAEVAGLFLNESAPADNCHVHFLHVNHDRDDGERVLHRIKDFLETYQQMHPHARWVDHLETELIVSKEILPSIAKMSAKYDLMVLDATRGFWRRRHVFGQMHKAIVRLSECPVVLAKGKEAPLQFGIQKFLQFFRDINQNGNHQQKVRIP